ncbi:serine protease [Gilvimarinus agarilyticus]|uniref:PA14 domain-containing protein n=1 Tax=unclassified Gilvimarinus TaxID=2642066 RepID=UPI001C0A58BB|nr:MULTISPECIES: PA14 domain-containing protein [unclassified Gilvimarinus]MBU2885648.1 serine protease [Gilvimarinus agarilyticus]MDO6570507.1 PA14 domain-containing protein [Gilvimarinus sp. 2_MG-2023]MDO6747448.1 PA14 domain-containing protein [Gilvimarinus sp. 1_MG-2023]
MINRNTIFSVLIAATVSVIIYRLIPPSVEPNFTLTLSKSRNNIVKINQPRTISESREMVIDRIELNERSRFQHPKLGPLGWSENFFADIESRFKVTESGRYRFLTGSDDGFRLAIDGNVLCQFPGDRPYRKQACYQTLEVGEHLLELNYFQGYGNAGLTLEVTKSDVKSPQFWGEKIEGIEYIQP